MVSGGNALNEKDKEHAKEQRRLQLALEEEQMRQEQLMAEKQRQEEELLVKE